MAVTTLKQNSAVVCQPFPRPLFASSASRMK